MSNWMSSMTCLFNDLSNDLQVKKSGHSSTHPRQFRGHDRSVWRHRWRRDRYDVTRYVSGALGGRHSPRRERWALPLCDVTGTNVWARWLIMMGADSLFLFWFGFKRGFNTKRVLQWKSSSNCRRNRNRIINYFTIIIARPVLINFIE